MVLVFPFPRDLQLTKAGARAPRGPSADTWLNWGAGLSALELCGSTPPEAVPAPQP